MRHNVQSLTLSYPRGFATRNDGNLSLIPGSHLFRDPDNCNGRMLDEDGQVLPSGEQCPLADFSWFSFVLGCVFTPTGLDW